MRRTVHTPALSLAALSLLFWALPGPAAAAAARPAATGTGSTASGSTSTVTRVYGESRQQTALALALAEYPNGVPSHTAILAAGDPAHLVDALTAAPLAYRLQAPILLADNSRQLGSLTAGGLTTLGVDQVILIGAVANPVFRSSLPPGITVAAVYSGASRFATAAEVARALAALEGRPFRQLFLTAADQANLVDALSAAPAAAMTGSPILLLPNPQAGVSTVPASEAGFVYASQAVYQIGLMSRIQVDGLGSGSTIYRLGGSSRFATSLAIDQAFFPRPASVFIANGAQTHIVDALAAGPYAAALGAPILLVNNGIVTRSGSTYLQQLAHSAVSYVVLGGPASIPSTLTASLETGMDARRTASPPVPSSGMSSTGGGFSPGNPFGRHNGMGF
ncbi:exported protein of unknown function [Candidatus Hydrogenisulfobacillus filiaventi]|uniref:Cell wall-binding repeat-containing protein n=1 Tax=Candidatus Hydrogenisulfobacillus filiaventi TaxID=2707344 RepID=A0A6F8ZCM5_9FIRM|nr:exported protein of unknown function [Candidatus Hydrogenisulfobacillus filiaventi]